MQQVGNDQSDYDDDRSSSVRSTQLMESIEPYVRKQHLIKKSLSRRKLQLSDDEQTVLRMNINSRERRRMHDLNDALDRLRKVLPYAKGGNARKTSKIGTLVLAGNRIRQLEMANEELRRLLLIAETKTVGRAAQSLLIPDLQFGPFYGQNQSLLLSNSSMTNNSPCSKRTKGPTALCACINCILTSGFQNSLLRLPFISSGDLSV